MQFDYRRFLHANAKIMDMLEVAKRSADMMIDHLPAVFAVVSENGEILRANERLAELFGSTVEELRGRKLTELLYDEDQGALLEGISDSSKDDIEINVECPLKLQSGGTPGTERHYSWKISVYSDAANFRLIGILGTDVTDLREIMIRSIMK